MLDDLTRHSFLHCGQGRWGRGEVPRTRLAGFFRQPSEPRQGPQEIFARVRQTASTGHKLRLCLLVSEDASYNHLADATWANSGPKAWPQALTPWRPGEPSAVCSVAPTHTHRGLDFSCLRWLVPCLQSLKP